MFESYLGKQIVTGTYQDALLLEKLDYNELRDDALSPQHGYGVYHIGHQDPTLTPRHVPANVAWRTSRSNLIQGNMTLREARIALIRKGQTAEGIALLEKGMAVWEGAGGRVVTPYWRSVLAEGMAQLGNLDGALHLIDEVIAEIERPDRQERHYYAEALRIKGGLLSLKGDPGGAEHAYLASLDWARTQQAKSWELRTATSYARLLRDQGRAREAHDLLTPIYGWFTEGFDTADLKEAKVLLDELA